MTDEITKDPFPDLQKEVYDWSIENFGVEQPPEYPLVGAGEELGELTTSILKSAQGIDDSEKYADRVGPAAERDALADIEIYLADFWARVHNASGENQDIAVDELLLTYAAFGELCRAAYEERDVKEATSRVRFRLAEIAEIRDVDLDEAVIDTWEEVSGREWNADLTIDND